MHDVETPTFALGRQRQREEETEYGPDVPLATRLRLEQEHLHL